MKPRPHRETGQTDLFRLGLDQIVNPDNEVVQLGRRIDWGFIEAKCGEAYSDVPGQPPLPIRLMAGLSILKHTFGLSDEELCARFLDSPHFQYFCGEEFFRHDLPFERSSLSRFRQRVGEERLNALLQESLAVAVKTKAMRLSDLTEAIVDTTVQEKAVAFPTDAKALPPRPRAAGSAGQAPRREIMKRRAAVEPVIGHMKAEHRMGRNYLAHAAGDAINAVLAVAGYNFRRILSWLRLLLAWIAYTSRASEPPQPA